MIEDSGKRFGKDSVRNTAVLELEDSGSLGSQWWNRSGRGLIAGVISLCGTAEGVGSLCGTAAGVDSLCGNAAGADSLYGAAAGADSLKGIAASVDSLCGTRTRGL